MKNKSLILIGVGVANIIHAILHFVQFLQSVLWISTQNETIDEILHTPVFSVIWALIGILSLWIGIKDFNHHKKCK